MTENRSLFFIKLKILFFAIFLILGGAFLIWGAIGLFMGNSNGAAGTASLWICQGGIVATMLSAPRLAKYWKLAREKPDEATPRSAAEKTNNRHIPPELDQPLPRCVKMTGSFIFMLVLTTVMFVGLGLFMVGTAYNTSHDQAILKASGVAAEADVVNLTIQHGKPPRIYYRVSYQFQPKLTPNIELPIQTATRQTNKAQFEQLQIGQVVPILYDPKNPGRSDLNFNDRLHTSDPYAIMPIMFGMTGGFIGLPYIFIMAMTLFSYFKQRKLVQWGSAAMATLVEEKEIKGRHPTITATYEFTDALGATIQGTQKYLPIDEQSKSEAVRKLKSSIRDNPIALYDPENSSTNILYSSGYVRCYRP